MESGQSLAALLDELVGALEVKGHHVRQHLQPGLSRSRLLEKTAALPFAFPEDLMALYMWRNGQPEAAAWDADALCFRDNTFISVERALDAYVRQYKEAEPWDSLDRYGVALHSCFPFAAFEGAQYVIVCGPHRLKTAEPSPIVSIFHGIDLYFYSLQSMVSTCIAWVRDPHWTKESHLGLREDIEMKIWQEHNPGIFS